MTNDISVHQSDTPWCEVGFCPNKATWKEEGYDLCDEHGVEDVERVGTLRT